MCAPWSSRCMHCTWPPPGPWQWHVVWRSPSASSASAGMRTSTMTWHGHWAGVSTSFSSSAGGQRSITPLNDWRSTRTAITTRWRSGAGRWPEHNWLITKVDSRTLSGSAAKRSSWRIRGGHQAADFTYRILVSACRLKTSGGPLEPGFRFVQNGPDVFHVFPAMLAAEAGDLEKAAPLFVLAVPVMHEPRRERSPGADPRGPRGGRVGIEPGRYRTVDPCRLSSRSPMSWLCQQRGKQPLWAASVAILARWPHSWPTGTVSRLTSPCDAAQPRDWRARGTCRNPPRLGDRSAASWTGA